MIDSASQVERRRHPRFPDAEPATILIGPTSLVFGRTLNWSRGGACLRPPSRFAVKIGELINVASSRIGTERAARIVGITPGGVHCAFESDLAEAC
ncbi:MAG: PilZ domain-containing protein [Alphaproteobacteria bacterium]|nr:PilZ domain-containing protein [Alphaproteobacteria bacterium]